MVTGILIAIGGAIIIIVSAVLFNRSPQEQNTSTRPEQKQEEQAVAPHSANISFSFDSATNNGEKLTKSAEFTRTIVLTNPNEWGISSYDINLTFTNNLLRVVSIDGSGAPLATVLSQHNNDTGTIRIMQVNPAPQNPDPNTRTLSVARITFEVLNSPGIANVTFDDIQLYGREAQDTNQASEAITSLNTSPGIYTIE